MTQVKTFEVWRQDTQDQDLWHGTKGVIINSEALAERQVYFEIIRVPALSFVNTVVPDNALGKA